MPGRKKESIDLILMKGNKLELTKTEIEQRRLEEAAARGPCDKITPPTYLTAKQKKEFEELANELLRVGIFSNLDVDTLAQYIDTRHQYVEVTKALRKFKPTVERVNKSTGEINHSSSRDYNSLQRTKDLLIRQCRSIAGELGLNLNARLKLVIPKKEEKKESKFSKFGGN